MPLSDTMRKKVENFARPNNQTGQNEIFNLLKEAINSGETTPQDILEYANFQWTNTKRYVIEAETLNFLGVFISGLENKEHKKLSGNFFNIAADRDSPWACRNYANWAINGSTLHGVLKSPEAALQYAQKAVELSKATPHIFKLVLANALRANQRYLDASTALADYLNYHLKQTSQNYKKEETQTGIKLLEQFLSEFTALFAPASPVVNQETAQAALLQIENFLGKQFTCAADKETQTKIHSITQQLHYFRGRCLEILEQKSEAMLAHCNVIDKNSPIYPTSVQARARLLKETVAEMLLGEAKAPALDEATTITAQLAATNLESPALAASSFIADSFIEQTSFAEHWIKGNNSFDFLYPEQLAESYQLTSKEINTLISAKEIEIELLTKKSQKLAHGASAASAGVIADIDTKLEFLKTELKALNDAKNKMSTTHQQHTPGQRHIFRRSESEARFFNPQRLKNKEAIVALTHQIIDQRFGLADAAHPVNLTGVSVRRLAAAEKAFQNAVIQLTGARNPKTGIPIARDNPWDMGFSSGSNNYGPIENYLIGETPIKFEHRENPKPQRLGDSYSPDHGKYGTYDASIYPFLRKLVQDNPEKEKQLARLLINFGRKQEPISLAELQALFPDANESTVHKFNQICALIMAKEQVQWLSATDKKFRGLSVLHARCLLLIEKGFLTLAEVFQNDGIFSVYSNKNIIYDPSRLEAACLRIESLYGEYLKTLYPADYLRMFSTELATEKKIGIVVTREQAHQDLRNVYGGESDSDGEGYGSDIEFSGPRQ